MKTIKIYFIDETLLEFAVPDRSGVVEKMQTYFELQKVGSFSVNKILYMIDFSKIKWIIVEGSV